MNNQKVLPAYVKLKRSKVPKAVPLPSQIDTQTLVHNQTDGIWYFKRIDDAGNETILSLGGVPVNPQGPLVDVYVKDDPNWPVIEHLYKLRGTTVSRITSIMKPSGVVRGGDVVWQELLTFIVGNTIYYINGDLFTVVSTSLTLSPADPDLPRIDVIIVDTDETVSCIKGVPASDPQKPTIDTTQIELTQVLIMAGATTPSGITNVVMYDEYAAGEFTPAATGVTVDFAYTEIAPYHGTKCMNVGLITNGDIISLTSGTPLPIADYTNLMCALKLKAVATKQHQLYVQFLLNGTAICNEILIPFNINDITTWQVLTLQLTTQVFTGTTFNQCRFIWRKSGSQVYHYGFYFDFIQLTGGIETPVFNDSVVLTGDVLASGHTGTPIPATLKTVNANPGTVGSAAKIPVLTVDAKGRVTQQSETDFPVPADGITPHIGENLHWWIGETDTGIVAEGQDGNDGDTPYIGENGNWWIGTTDTGVPAGGDSYEDWSFGVDTEGGDVLTPIATKEKVYFQRGDGIGFFRTTDAEKGNVLTIVNTGVITSIPTNSLTGNGCKALFTANENQVFGDPVFINPAGKAQKANATALATASATGICLATVAANASTLYGLSPCFLRNDNWSWTIGGIIYLSMTGTLTQTSPTTANAVIQALGVAVSSTVILFNPSLSQVEYK